MSSKNRQYSVIFYGCLLVAVVLFGIVLFPKTPAEDTKYVYTTTAATTTATSTTAPKTTKATTAATTKNNKMSFHWSETELKTMFADALADTLPDAEITKVELAEPNQCTVVGRLPRSAVQTIAKNAGVELGEAAQIALKLAPNVLDLRISFTADVQDGSIVTEPQSFSAESVDLPVGMFPEDAKTAINTALNTAIYAQKYQPEDLFISGGLLYLDCKIK